MATLVVVAAAGCQEPPAPPDRDERCARIEARDYAVLEPMVTPLFTRVEHAQQRYSFCDEAGMPGAAVVVEVDGWTSRAEAVDLLAARGWKRVDDPEFVVYEDPTGNVRVNVGVTTEDDATHAYLRFATIESIERMKRQT